MWGKFYVWCGPLQQYFSSHINTRVSYHPIQHPLLFPLHAPYMMFHKPTPLWQQQYSCCSSSTPEQWYLQKKWCTRFKTTPCQATSGGLIFTSLRTRYLFPGLFVYIIHIIPGIVCMVQRVGLVWNTKQKKWFSYITLTLTLLSYVCMYDFTTTTTLWHAVAL